MLTYICLHGRIVKKIVGILLKRVVKVMTYRIIITKENSRYFYGKSFNDKKYKILKNENTNKFKVGKDFCFYAKKQVNLLSTILIPISDEEAGVRAI